MYLQKELKCPYCNNILNSIPKRKTKCKTCGNYFYIRTRLDDKAKVIVTEKECSEIDLINSVLLSGVISEEEFIKAKKSEQIKSNKDIIWRLFNEKILYLSKKNDLGGLADIYYHMAEFTHKEGRDSFYLLQQSAKCRLVNYKNLGVKTVEILTTNPCEYCKKMEGKKLGIQEALETMPIPAKECQMDLFNTGKTFCRCTYMQSFDDMSPLEITKYGQKLTDKEKKGEIGKGKKSCLGCFGVIILLIIIGVIVILLKT